jgi:tRNA(Ile)-lysidine synthase
MSRPHSPEDAGLQVKGHLHDCGVSPGDLLIVACSGGLDSVTLLHLLRFGGGHEPTALVVGHFDHRMRPGSRDDAAWVRGLCRGWGVPIREGFAAGQLSSETDARRERWRFLEGIATELGAVGVVTAHHADDQVETVVHHVLRGTGPRGMSGMATRDGMRVRPLLEIDRATIESWAEARGLPMRLDPTNLEALNPRNHLRLEGLPLLESIRPGARRGILRSARLAGQAEAALSQAEGLLLPSIVERALPDRVEADLVALVAMGSALRARLLRRLARDVGGRLDEAGTRAAMEFTIGRSGGGVCRLAGGVVLRRSLGVLEIEGPGRGPEPADQLLEIQSPAPGSGVVAIGGERWRVEWGSAGAPGPWAASLPRDALDFPLRVRRWRAGDRVRREEQERSVSRLWSKEGIPLHERERRPVVEDQRGRLVWVPGSVLGPREVEPPKTPFFMEFARVDNY